MSKSDNIYNIFTNFCQNKNNIDVSEHLIYNHDSLWNNLMNISINEKYFDKIDEYNKDIVSYRQSFFKNVSTTDLRKLLDILTYNLDFNSSNYRWGKRFFDKRLNKFTWTSSTNKQIQVFYYDKKTHQNKSFYKDVFFTDNNINDHFLSCYKQDRKISFYYSLSDSEKNELKQYHTSLKNMYKIHDKTFGASQKLNSDVLLIDIDNRPDRPAIKTLKKLLDFLKIEVKDLMMLEQNVFSGGIHTAIKLPHIIINEKFYGDFMSYLKSHNIIIECNFIHNFLRLPLSYEYSTIQKYEKILDFEEFIPQEFWEPSFDEYLKNINQKPCKSKVLKDMILEYHQTNCFNKWENYWSHKKTLFFRPSNLDGIKHTVKLYDIISGYRYETMSKMIPYLKGLGYSLDEVVDKLIEKNINSKDLSKWSRVKLRNNIQSFYDKCNISFLNNKTPFNGFVSNIPNLPDKTLQFLSSVEFGQFITQKFICNYLKERNKHNMGLKSLSDEKIEILNKQIPYMIKEIIGAMFYHINNPKFSIINERIGFQLSDTYLSKLQEQSIIDLKLDKNNSLTKTSLQYLKKAIISSLSLIEINYKNRKRNWMNGSCKSYEIISLSDLYNLLQHLFNCFNDFDYSLFNNINPHILYILLGENKGFVRDYEILLNNNDPPD